MGPSGLSAPCNPKVQAGWRVQLGRLLEPPQGKDTPVAPAFPRGSLISRAQVRGSSVTPPPSPGQPAQQPVHPSPEPPLCQPGSAGARATLCQHYWAAPAPSVGLSLLAPTWGVPVGALMQVPVMGHRIGAMLGEEFPPKMQSNHKQCKRIKVKNNPGLGWV